MGQLFIKINKLFAEIFFVQMSCCCYAMKILVENSSFGLISISNIVNFNFRAKKEKWSICNFKSVNGKRRVCYFVHNANMLSNVSCPKTTQNK